MSRPLRLFSPPACQPAMSHAERRAAGAFYTPPEIVRLIADLALRQQKASDRPPRILDAACGAGEFALQAFQTLRAQFSDEAARGSINHALRFTARKTRRAYVYPARHYASDSNDPSLPPMGLRVRLKASFDIGGYPPQARVVLTALKRYGMILADNGAPWFISGAPDPHWSNDQVHTLGQLHGSDFEVVDTSSLPRS